MHLSIQEQKGSTCVLKTVTCYTHVTFNGQSIQVNYLFYENPVQTERQFSESLSVT